MTQICLCQFSCQHYAQKEIAAGHRGSDSSVDKVREVFENEKYDAISRTWKPIGIFLCSSPNTPAKDIFDPKRNSGADDKNTWVIDYSLNGIDSEGWTYAYDNATLIKSGVGESSMKWNSYIRSREGRISGGFWNVNDVVCRNRWRLFSSPHSPIEIV